MFRLCGMLFPDLIRQRLRGTADGKHCQKRQLEPALDELQRVREEDRRHGSCRRTPQVVGPAGSRGKKQKKHHKDRPDYCSASAGQRTVEQEKRSGKDAAQPESSPGPADQPVQSEPQDCGVQSADRQEVGDPVSAVSLVQVLRHAVPVSQQRRFQDAGILRGKDLIQLLLRRAPQGKQKPGRGEQPEQTALLPPCHGDPVRVKAVGHPLCFVIRCGVKLSRVPRLRKTGQFPEGCRPAADIRYSVYILRAAVHQQAPVPKLQALPVLLKVLNDELDPGLLFCCAHPLVQSPLLLPRHLRRSHPKHPGCRRRGKQRRSQANTRKATRCGAADRKTKYCGANTPQKQHQKESGQACARRPQRASLQNDQLSKHDSGRQDLPRPFHSDPVLLILL